MTLTRKSFLLLLLAMVGSAVLGSALTLAVSARRAEAQTSQITGNRIVLSDYFGNERGVMELTPFGGVQLAVSGYYNDLPRAALSVQPSGSTGLDLRDATGRVRASFALRPDGTPFLALLDPSGRVVWSTP